MGQSATGLQTTHSSWHSTSLHTLHSYVNPIEEFWKVYDRHPHQQVALLQAMEEACGDIDQASCQAWIRHSRTYFPRCLGPEDIACDVDGILRPNPERRHDVGWFFFLFCFFVKLLFCVLTLSWFLWVWINTNTWSLYPCMFTWHYDKSMTSNWHLYTETAKARCVLYSYHQCVVGTLCA